MSFITDRIKTEGLTFDDVLLVPAYSEVLPREVDITSKFTRNIRLNTPIVSAAMDTVTEAELAIAIAREGGIGVIHKNMSIAAQAAQVRKVKRAENGMIYDPITISKDNTVGDALKLMHDNKIGGIPVVNDSNILIGIVTNRDLRFQRDMSRKIEEVMTHEGLVTTTNPDLAHAADILLQNKIEKLPVVDANGKLVGLLTYKDITKVQQNPNACKDAKGRLRVAAGVGVTPDSMERVAALHDSQVDVVVLDSAHGHSKNIVNLLKQIKATYTDIDVVVGNIATGEAARYLADAGADGVKVGIGPGSICTTRVIAGVGVPQLEAIYDVAKALKGSDVGIIADGGLRYSGDIVKALAAGGDCVMAGSMFAGVEESPGDWRPNGCDLKYIRIYAKDSEGRRVPDASSFLTVKVDGAAQLYALDNGDHYTDELFNVDRKAMKDGFMLAILKSGRQPGKVKVHVQGEGLLPVSSFLEVR